MEDEEKTPLTGEDFFIYGSDLNEFLNIKNWKPYLWGLGIIAGVLVLAIIIALN